MVSGGLSWTDVGDARVLGGLARRFYAAVADHYGAPLWGVTASVTISPSGAHEPAC